MGWSLVYLKKKKLEALLSWIRNQHTCLFRFLIKTYRNYQQLYLQGLRQAGLEMFARLLKSLLTRGLLETQGQTGFKSKLATATLKTLAHPTLCQEEIVLACLETKSERNSFCLKTKKWHHTKLDLNTMISKHLESQGSMKSKLK